MPIEPRAVERARGRRPTRAERVAVRVIAVASAVGAALAGTHSTATTVSDVVLAALLGGGVALAASRARPWALVAASGIAAAAGGGAWAILAVAALTVSVVSAVREWRHPDALGALVGAVAVQVLLRGPHRSLGVDVAIGMAAVGCLVLSGWRGSSDDTRAALRKVAIGAGAALAVVGGVVVVTGFLARGRVAAGIDRAQDGIKAARAGSSDDAAAMLDKATDEFQSAHSYLGGWWVKPALLVPVLGPQTHALDLLTDAGAHLAGGAAEAARRADVQTLKVSHGQLDLDRVRELDGPLASVTRALEAAGQSANRADSAWLLPPVADRLDAFTDDVRSAQHDVANASAAVANLPDILGGAGERNYFVAFATPSETRDLGGFMGAYGILTAENGKVTLSKTGRVRDINESGDGRKLTAPEDFPDRFRALQPEVFWQNVTGTSDFPTVAEAIRQMWPQTSDIRIDGVMYMDPYTLAALLELTGPVTVKDYDQRLSADMAAQFLLRDQYAVFPFDDRHDFLVSAATTVFNALTAGDLPGPARIADTLAPSANEGRLLLHSFHPAEQALFERLHLDGTLPSVRGDYLSVRASNRGLSKIDAYMERTILDNVTVDPTRNLVTAVVAVKVKNTAPASGLPFEVIGNHVGKRQGTNSTTVSIVTPLNVTDVTRNGVSVGRGSYVEYGRHVYSALLDVPAGTESTVVFNLRGSLDLSHGYTLDVIPQPLANPDRISIHVRGASGWTAPSGPAMLAVLRVPRHLDVVLRD